MRDDEHEKTEILFFFYYPRLCSLNINKEPSMFLVMKLTPIFFIIKKLAHLHVYVKTCIRVIHCIFLETIAHIVYVLFSFQIANKYAILLYNM